MRGEASKVGDKIAPTIKRVQKNLERGVKALNAKAESELAVAARSVEVPKGSSTGSKILKGVGLVGAAAGGACYGGQYITDHYLNPIEKDGGDIPPEPIVPPAESPVTTEGVSPWLIGGGLAGASALAWKFKDKILSEEWSKSLDSAAETVFKKSKACLDWLCFWKNRDNEDDAIDGNRGEEPQGRGINVNEGTDDQGLRQAQLANILRARDNASQEDLDAAQRKFMREIQGSYANDGHGTQSGAGFEFAEAKFDDPFWRS